MIKKPIQKLNGWDSHRQPGYFSDMTVTITKIGQTTCWEIQYQTAHNQGSYYHITQQTGPSLGHCVEVIQGQTGEIIISLISNAQLNLQCVLLITGS